MAAGTFRDDLFYRLNVFPIQVPACASVRTTSRSWCGTSSTSLGVLGKRIETITDENM